MLRQRLLFMPTLNELLKNPQLWRSSRRNQAIVRNSIPTGYQALNTALHSRGWPLAGSTELLCDPVGIGELGLLMPALVQLSQQQTIAWLNAPFQTYAPALQQAGLKLENCLFIRTNRLSDHLWACEELLRSSTCAAVLNWSGEARLNDRDLRRLQLAARDNQCWHVHFRAEGLRSHSSPAPLRINLQSDPANLRIQILKQPGGPAGQAVSLPREPRLVHAQLPPEQWPRLSQRSRKQRLLLAPPLPRPLIPDSLELH